MRRVAWLWLVLVVVRAQEDDLIVHKMCRIPRFRAVKFHDEGEEKQERPEEVAGGFVKSDMSAPLYYKCDYRASTWSRAVCQDGHWTPEIPSHCIVHTCYHGGRNYQPDASISTSCQRSYRPHYGIVTVTMKCVGDQGYWSTNGCGQPFMKRDCRTLSSYRYADMYTIADQPAQPIFLQDRGPESIVLCPKGKTLELCERGHHACPASNKHWYKIGSELYSGLEADCSSTEMFYKRSRHSFICKDVDECAVLAHEERNLRLQDECESNTRGSGSGKQPMDAVDDDSEQECEHPNLHLAERGITACHPSASCVNKDGGYDCRCPNHLRQQTDGSCTRVDGQNNEENHWAVLAAGSSTWENYRHQADICHAYQILISHGFHPDRIITFMYDDIAHSPRNPTPGVVINQPGGRDVYRGIRIDYRGSDVTPSNFLAVLNGDASAVSGRGTGRVLESGANDHVFVNFADHGAPGLLGFPNDILKASELMSTIRNMHSKQMYKQMVFYVEACESGSMFAGLLPTDINLNVYATTAANPTESSYACYYDGQRQTFLGDVYSVKWMEDSDRNDLRRETLEQQFQRVKKQTSQSHVQEYGDKSIADEELAEFQGGKEYRQPRILSRPNSNAQNDAVASEDVPMAILQHRHEASRSDEERSRVESHIRWHETVRERIDELMEGIVHMASRGSNARAKEITDQHSSLVDHECYEQAVDAFDDHCVRIPQNDYALRRLYILVNLCEARIPAQAIITSIVQTCAGNFGL